MEPGMEEGNEAFCPKDALDLCDCKDYESLESINVKNRGIKRLSDDFFSTLGNLKEIDLSGNDLHALPLTRNCENLLKIDISHNKLQSINEIIFFNKLEHLDISGNDHIQVSDRYKLVSTLSALKTLDGKDIGLMREAIGRLDAMLASKLKEMLRSAEIKKLYMHVNLSDEKEVKEAEAAVLITVKKKITCGPEVLKSYRDFKLDAFIQSELPDTIRKQQDSANGNKENGGSISQGKRTSVEKDGLKEKKRKNAECQVDQVGAGSDGSKYILKYLLQTHSMNNDPKDWDTKVWMCEFEPDVNNPGETTGICATCGGDSVCFIDCNTGQVLKKYKQPQEVFYCLAWTVVEKSDESSGKLVKASMLAVAGLHGDIKLIDPQQLICYQEVSHHKKAIDALVFHPIHPTWLFSGSEDKTIILWDINIPSSPALAVKKLLTLKSSNIVRQIVVIPHGRIMVGSCDDGCYVWNIDNVDEHQTRSAVFKFIFPGERRLPVDSVSCISNTIVGANKLLAGDDEGFVWLYDLSKIHGQLPDPEERDRKGPLELRHSKCLRCSNQLARLFNHVSAGQQMKFIVAVSDTNVVAIWKRDQASRS
eukprot:gene16021-7364_t